MKRIFKRLFSLYRKTFWSLERQARHAGVKVGKNNFIASRFWSTEPYLIEIGDHCQITGGVRIFTHGGSNSVRKKYPKFDTFGKVKIGNYVYIGNNALIMPGVTIEDNVLVAAGSVVTKSIPANSVVGGNPARYIGTLQEYLERNLRNNTNTKGLTAAEKKKILLTADEDIFVKKTFLKTP